MSLCSSLSPLLSQTDLLQKKNIFTCFSNWCEWSACSQVSFGSSVLPVISSDVCQWLWCGQDWADLVSLVLLLVWFPQGCTLDIHRLNREDGACVDGGRTNVCELGCPFRVCVAYFSASPAVFSASFILSPLFSCRNLSHQCDVEG